MKKCLAFLVVIVLLAGMFAVSVSAATLIPEVSIEVTAPSAAKCPSYNSTLGHNTYVLDDETNEYKFNGITWQNGDNYSATNMLPTDKYEIGEVYTVKIELYVANNNYAFRTNPAITAKINGQTAYISYANSNYIILEYTFPAIEGYTVTFNSGSGSGSMAPRQDVAGDFTLPICTFTNPEGKVFAGWSVSGMSGVFQVGDKVPVSNNVTVTANWETPSGKQKIYDVVATSEDIDTIPKLYGRIKIPQFTLTEGSPAYINATTANLNWQKKVGEIWETQHSGRFTAGEWRILTSVRIDRTNAYTHELGNPTTLTVNGQQWIPDNGTGEPLVYPEYSCLFFYSPTFVIEDDPNIQPPVQIDTVNIKLNGYLPGADVSAATISSDSNIEFVEKFFFSVVDEAGDGIENDIPEEATGQFTADKIYLVCVEFTAKDGYDISALTQFDVFVENGLTPMFSKYNEENDSYRIIIQLKQPMASGPQFAKSGGKYVYYVDGVKTEITDLVKVNGKWFYVENGIWANTLNKLHKINGKWFLIKGGKWTATTSIEPYNGKYFYIVGGKWNSSVTDLKKVDGKWYYIQNGKWNKSIDTLHKINGKWFLIKKGMWNKTTGLVDYKDKTFYVVGGKWNSGVNTLYKKGTKLYAVKSGKLYTGKVVLSYGGKEYYCNKGYAQTSYSGKVTIGSKIYTVKKGLVKAVVYK